MKIIIAGGGKIGSTLTRHLSNEGYELTVMDIDRDVLERIIENYDVMSINGNCATMSALEAAGVKDSDMIVACTRSDEINLLCCMTARTMNRRIHTVGRIRNPEYFDQVHKLGSHFEINMSINPERQAASEICRLLEYPAFLRREAFMKSRVEIVELLIDEESKLNGACLKDLDSIVKTKVLVCNVVRNDESIIPDGEFIIQEGDRVFVTAPASGLATLLKSLGFISKRVKRVMIAGGGTISYYLAKQLIRLGVYVKIIEIKEQRCLELADKLPEAEIICGDCTSTDVLDQELLSEYDAFVACSGMDEMNIVTSIYAKDIGVPKIITKVARPGSTDIVDRLSIGSAVCPQELCGNVLVTYAGAVRNKSGAAVSVHYIARGMATAMEFYVNETTRFKGIPLKDIKIKKGVLVVSISHGYKVQISDGDSVFDDGDSIVIVTNGDTKILQLNDIFD